MYKRRIIPSPYDKYRPYIKVLTIVIWLAGLSLPYIYFNQLMEKGVQYILVFTSIITLIGMNFSYKNKPARLLLFIIGITLVASFILWPKIKLMHTARTCLSNLSHIGNTFQTNKYYKSYNPTFDILNDGILKNTDVLICPIAHNQSSKKDYGYHFNTTLRKEKTISPGTLIAICPYHKVGLYADGRCQPLPEDTPYKMFYSYMPFIDMGHTTVMEGKITDLQPMKEGDNTDIRCHYDPKFIVTIKTATGIKTLAIHSPSKFFDLPEAATISDTEEKSTTV